MKNRKQMLSWLLALVMILGLLSGCGSANTSKQDSSAKESSVTEASSQETQSSAEETVNSEEASETENVQDCSVEKTQEENTSDEISEIIGEYLLDGTPLGMPMTWYLKISEDGSFQISTKRDYAADKGNGQVAANNGTYVLVYSDSTNDAPKTATFRMEKGNAYFTSSLPIGTANMPGSEDEPFIGYCFANEELLGDYVASYDSEGAMGSVHYDQELTLDTGRRYVYTSVFTMKENTYKHVENGSFEIKDDAITLTAAAKVTAATLETGETIPCDPEETVGTIADGKITIALATSPMKADKVENVFTAATTAEAAGKYLAYKQTEMFTLNAVLNLGKDGTYSYGSEFASDKMGQAVYAEKGTFVIAENGVVLTPTAVLGEDGEMTEAENAEAQELNRNGMLYEGQLPTGGMPTDVTLYPAQIVGTFEAADPESGLVDEVQYVPSMKMIADGTFTLTVTAEGTEPYVCDGTFSAEDSMITFTYEGGAYSFIAMMSDNSFNAKNIPLDEGGTEASFEFVPAADSQEEESQAEESQTEESSTEVTETEESQAEENSAEASQVEESQGTENSTDETQTEESAAVDNTAEDADVIRSFSGGYVSESAMGTTQYSLSLNLKNNDTYRLESVFVMGGKAYVSAEEGVYTLEGETLSLTPKMTTTMQTIESGELVEIAEEEQAEISASLKDGVLTMTHKPSCMAKAEGEIVLNR